MRKLITVVCLAVATLGAGASAASASASPAVQRDAKFAISCLDRRPALTCYTGAWERAIAVVDAATAHASATRKWCPAHVHYGAWRDGFCLGAEDDASPHAATLSHRGIIARMRLAL